MTADITVKYWAPGEFPSGSSATLDAVETLSFLAELRSAGQAQIVQMNDATTEPTTGGMVTFDVQGTRAFAALARTLSRVTVAPGEESDEKTTWDMPGHLAVTKNGVIGPPGGVGSSPVADTIAYNWSHPDYDDSAWTPANALCLVQDAQAGGSDQWPDQPWSDDWTEPISLEADIIGPDDGTAVNVSNPNAANQIHYFRQPIIVNVAARHTFYISCDNAAEVYIDGVLICTYGEWASLGRFSVDLSVGVHAVAVRLQNFPQASANPCGYSWALYRTGGYPAPFVGRSTASATVHVEYQASAPGMTVGTVIRLALQEHIDAGRSWASDIILDFDDVNDSDGNPWSVEPNITATVLDDTFLDLITKLQASYADIYMDPTSWTLHAYGFSDFTPASGVELETGRNITQLVHKTEDVTATELLLRSDGLGYSSRGSGDVQAGLRLGSERAAVDVNSIADEVLAIFATPRLEITAAVAPDLTASPGEVPWVNADYVPGSTITVPDLDGDPVVRRVLSLGCSISGRDEDLQVVVTANDRIQELNERMIADLKS